MVILVMFLSVKKLVVMLTKLSVIQSKSITVGWFWYGLFSMAYKARFVRQSTFVSDYLFDGWYQEFMATLKVVSRSQIKAGQFVILFCDGNKLLIETEYLGALWL